MNLIIMLQCLDRKIVEKNIHKEGQSQINKLEMKLICLRKSEKIKFLRFAISRNECVFCMCM